jgi:hypothetical protein
MHVYTLYIQACIYSVYTGMYIQMYVIIKPGLEILGEVSGLPLELVYAYIHTCIHEHIHRKIHR